MLFRSFAAGDLASWARRLGDADLPVLRSTARQIARLAAAGDEDLGTREVADVVLRDPLMTARLYKHIRRVGGDRQLAEITTVDRMITKVRSFGTSACQALKTCSASYLVRP